MANQPTQHSKGKDEGRAGQETGAQGMMEKAKDVASDMGRRAEDAASAVGGGLQSLAGTIRERAPREGMIGSASSTVARTLEGGGRYLQEEGFSGMMDDLGGLIRRNPIPAVLIGVGIGFLLARTTSRS